MFVVNNWLNRVTNMAVSRARVITASVAYLAVVYGRT